MHTAILLGGDNNGTDELDTPNSVGIFICCIRFPTGAYASYSSPQLSDYHLEWQSVYDTEKQWSLGLGGNDSLPETPNEAVAIGIFLSEEVCIEFGYTWYSSPTEQRLS